MGSTVFQTLTDDPHWWSCGQDKILNKIISRNHIVVNMVVFFEKGAVHRICKTNF